MAPSNMTDSTAVGLADTAFEATQATPPTEHLTASGAARAFTEPGARIKHYEIIRKLGEGGMGAVFLARDTRLGRRVAIKFLHEQSGPAMDRFLVEARATALCQHENIVIIHDVDEFEGFPYMVLEYIEGQTLRSAMVERSRTNTATSKSDPQWAIEVMLPVARALCAAHAMNIVHRDLKPENILLANSGLVKVVDFGIAKQSATPNPSPKNDEFVETLGNPNLTQYGATPGTMMYMSPEQWLSDEIDGRTDIWAAGLILFELLTGDHPLAPVSMGALTQVIRFDTDMPSAKEKRPDAAALGEVIDHCLRKRKDERCASAEELRSALEGLLHDRRAPILAEDQCPYAGLSAFQEADANKYFGRERDIAAVMGKLRNQELLAIVGPSGAGKSSFIRAGVFPAFKNASGHVETYVIRPGRNPLASLADILAFFADTSGNEERVDPAAIEERLLTEPGYLGVRLRARCRRRNAEHRILLLVDQFEELYTLGIESNVREAFCSSLLGIADDASSPLRVILSMRADFLDRVAEDRTFLSAVTRGIHFLPPMGADGLRDALEKPLERSRHQFEDPGLVDEILSSLVSMKSPLPILQFLASKLWEHRDKERRLLTTEAYRALGGIAGALSTHADAVVSAMPRAEQQITRAIFMRLVTPEKTRAIVSFDELQALSADKLVVEQAVQRLADARLITIETSDEREGKTVELVHESLIERWSKLRAWLDENERDAQFLVEVRSAAAQWEKNDRAPGFLWRDEAARKAESWMAARNASDHVDLGRRDLQYLNAVVHLAHQTRNRKRLFAGVLFSLTVAVVLIVSVLAIDARKQAHRADEQAARAREEARQARNATRLAAARELQSKDPTKALVLLRDIEPGSIPRGWTELVLQTRYAGVAERLTRHADMVFDARFSPDGKRIAAALYDRTVEIWNADGSGESIILRGHEHSVFSIDWSHDGRRVASGSRDHTIRIWNADGTGKPIVLSGHTGTVRRLEWSPDDRYLATTAHNDGMRIWKTDGSNESYVVGPEGDAKTLGIQWSPDGKHLAIGLYDGSMQIWDAAGKIMEMVLRGHTDAVTSIAWSADGSRLVSASRDKTLRIWNASGEGESVILKGHQDIVDTAQWSPDGHYVVSGSQDKTVRVWNVRNPEVPVVLHGHDDNVTSVDWSPDGRYILSASVDHEVRFWNADILKKRVTYVGHASDVHHVSFSPNGQRMVSASFDKTVRLWDLHDESAPRIVGNHDETVNSASFSHDGQKIVSSSEDKTVRIWSIDGKGEPLILRGHDDEVWDAQFTPDDKSVVSASSDDTVRIWNANGEGSPVILKGHERKVGAMAISPDGQHIASGSLDKTLRIWAIDGKTEPLILRGHKDGVWGTTWSPNGQHVLSSSEDWSIRVWNANGTGSPVVLEGHHALVQLHSQSAFHPDGRRFVSSSGDGTVRIWNIDGSGESIILHEGRVRINVATWSPDGRRIAAAFDDGTIIMWNDLELLDNGDDTRLWSATDYCLPLDMRRRMLGFVETQSQTDLAKCQQRVAKAFGRGE